MQLLSENETVSADSLLYRAVQHLSELCELDNRYTDVQNLLNEALIQVQEATNEIQSLSSNIEQDPTLLADIEQRLGQTVQLARKHNVKPQDLVVLHRHLKAELNELEDFSGSEEMLIQQEQAAHEKMLATATALHQSRQLGAQKLAQQVTKSIKQ